MQLNERFYGMEARDARTDLLLSFQLEYLTGGRTNPMAPTVQVFARLR